MRTSEKVENTKCHLVPLSWERMTRLREGQSGLLVDYIFCVKDAQETRSGGLVLIKNKTEIGIIGEEDQNKGK